MVIIDLTTWSFVFLCVWCLVFCMWRRVMIDMRARCESGFVWGGYMPGTTVVLGTPEHQVLCENVSSQRFGACMREFSWGMGRLDNAYFVCVCILVGFVG